MNPIDFVGANVSAEEIDLLDFETRDAIEAAQGTTSSFLQVVDDRPARPGTIRH